MEYSEYDLAYLAGYLDGEGCFTLARAHKPVIAVENTHKPTIEWLHKTFGGSMSKKLAVRKAHHRHTYRWAVVAKNAGDLCRAVAPFLREKAPQALMLIAIQQTKNHQGARKGLPPEVLAERERFASMLKEAKRVAW